jgi:hypothetical protein
MLRAVHLPTYEMPIAEDDSSDIPACGLFGRGGEESRDGNE